MKLFTKVALVSAIAISGQAMAMQAMDDSSLSAATGQDGITIALGLDRIAIGSLYVHDNDGLAVGTAASGTTPASATYGLGGTGDAGAITITGDGKGGRTDTAGIDIILNSAGGLVQYNGQNVLAKLDIDSDAGTGTDGAFLNINAKVSGLDIAIGKIGVAKSKAVSASTTRRGVDGSTNEIINGLNLKTGLTTANIQLGATPQGAMIVLNGTMQGGLEISNLELKDNGKDASGTINGGTINIGSLKMTDANGTDLSLDAKVSVTTNALMVNGLANATDMYVANTRLGSATAKSIGDIEVNGLQMSNGGTNGAIIYVAGH